MIKPLVTETEKKKEENKKEWSWLVKMSSHCNPKGMNIHHQGEHFKMHNE